MNRIYHWLGVLFKRKQTAIKQEVSALPADILAQISRESAFLRSNHAVEVHPLPDDFEAKKPHAVDPAVEESLPFIEHSQPKSDTPT